MIKSSIIRILSTSFIGNSMLSGILLSFFLLSCKQSSAEVVAVWNFQSSLPVNEGPIMPEEGGIGMSCSHVSSSVSYTNSGGNGSSIGYGSNNWAEGDHYLLHISTVGASNLLLSIDMKGSNLGPKSFELLYSLDNEIYFPVPGSGFDITNDAWSNTNYNAASTRTCSLPSALENLNSCYIKIAVSVGSTSINGGNISGNGTNRIDNIVLSTQSPLPIVFSRFSISRNKDSNQLNWETEHESALKDFRIEAGEDGKYFKEIATIAVSNTLGRNYYSYRDYAITKNQFYRIRALGLNDLSTYSNILVAKDGPDMAKGLVCGSYIKNGQLQVRCDGSAFKMTYVIQNTSGANQSAAKEVALTAGEHALDLSYLKSGFYVLRCHYAGVVYVFKIFKP